MPARNVFKRPENLFTAVWPRKFNEAKYPSIIYSMTYSHFFPFLQSEAGVFLSDKWTTTASLPRPHKDKTTSEVNVMLYSEQVNKANKS